MLWWNLQELKSSNTEKRRKAIRKLFEAKDPRAVEPLIMTLKDPDATVRQEAEETLRFIDPNWPRSPAARTVVPAYLQAVTEGEVEVRVAAAFVLGTIGDPRAVDPLIACLGNSEREIRKAAASALGMLRTRKAVEPLIGLLTDTDTEVRRCTVNSLWSIGDDRVVEPIAGQLRDESRVVREAAAEALQALGWQPGNVDEHAWFAVGSRQWETASRLGQPALPALLSALKDYDKSIQEGVVDALGKLGDPRAVDPLIDVLKHYDTGVRTGALKSLAIFHDQRTVDPISRLLKDNDKEIRKTAAKILGDLKDPNGFWPLTETLNDKDAGVRKTVAEALGKLGIHEGRDYLVRLIRDEDSDVREAVGDALLALKWQPADDVQRAQLAIAVRNWDAAVGYGAPALPILIESLSDKHNYIRMAASYALGKIQDPAAVELLIGVLKNRDSQIRAAAAEALGEMADPRAARPLLRLTADSEVASKVVGSIRKLLEINSGGLSNEELRLLATLKDVFQTHKESDKAGNPNYSWETKQPVNCSQVNKLAQEELFRRGMIA